MSVTVIIPTYNEQLHLARCLDSVVGWADRVYVLDSFSTDDTVRITEQYRDRGVQLAQNVYEGPAHQKNWALDTLEIPSTWVMFLDADEIVTPELAEEIVQVSDAGGNGSNGYYLNRRIIWYGRWIRRGGWFPNWNLRLFRKGCARYEMREVHEHMLVDGSSGFLEGHLIHEDLRDLGFSIAKHNRYSQLEACEYVRALKGQRGDYGHLLSRNPLARKRWIKTRLWPRLPAKPLLYFVWAYIFRLGFLDGMHGLRFLGMHAMYKHFDELKLWEMATYKDGAPEGAFSVKPSYWERYQQARGVSAEGATPARTTPTPAPTAPAPERRSGPVRDSDYASTGTSRHVEV